MNKFTIAIIKPNHIKYTDLDMNYTRLTKEKLLDDIENSVEFITVSDKEELFTIFSKYLNFKDNEWGDTIKWYDDHQYIYEICFNDDYYKKKNNINNIAQYLTNNFLRITDNVLLLKTKVELDGSYSNCNVTLNDIIDIYYKKFIHKEILIKYNGEINEVNYMINPIDHIKPDCISNFRYNEIQLHDKIMMVFFELKPSNDLPNEKASIIHGKKTNGNVIIALRNKEEDMTQIEHVYVDFTKDLFEKLLSVLSVKKNELVDTHDESFYQLLNNKYNNYKNKFGNSYLLEIYNNMKNDESINKLEFNKLK